MRRRGHRPKRHPPRGRKPEQLKRKLHFPDGSIWTWQTRREIIRIREPDNVTTHLVNLSEFSGWTWDALERADWKGYSYSITPREVKEWIRFRYLGVREDPRYLPEPELSAIDRLAALVDGDG